MHATATKPTWIYSWWVILPCLKVELKPAKNGGNHRYKARISYTSGKKNTITVEGIEVELLA